MKIYIAGPMRGIAQYNFPAFDAARDALRAAGHEPVSPADLDRIEFGFDAMTLAPDAPCNEFPAELDMETVARRDLEEVVGADAICLLPGWERSPGARAEAAVAAWLGKPRVTVTGAPWHGPNVLEEAQALTACDRQEQYGHPSAHFGRTAHALTARFLTGTDPLFRRPMVAQEWALCVAIDKLAGRGEDTRALKRDSLVDACGYCRTYEMCGDATKGGPK